MMLRRRGRLALETEDTQAAKNPLIQRSHDRLLERNGIPKRVDKPDLRKSTTTTERKRGKKPPRLKENAGDASRAGRGRSVSCWDGFLEASGETTKEPQRGMSQRKKEKGSRDPALLPLRNCWPPLRERRDISGMVLGEVPR